MPAPSKISVLHKWSARLPGERSHTLFAQREHNFLTNSQSKWFLVWGILGAAGGCEIPERTFSDSSGAGPGVSAPQLRTPPHSPTPTQERTSRTLEWGEPCPHRHCLVFTGLRLRLTSPKSMSSQLPSLKRAPRVRKVLSSAPVPCLANQVQKGGRPRPPVESEFAFSKFCSLTPLLAVMGGATEWGALQSRRLWQWLIWGLCPQSSFVALV